MAAGVIQTWASSLRGRRRTTWCRRSARTRRRGTGRRAALAWAEPHLARSEAQTLEPRDERLPPPAPEVRKAGAQERERRCHASPPDADLRAAWPRADSHPALAYVQVDAR